MNPFLASTFGHLAALLWVLASVLIAVSVGCGVVCCRGGRRPALGWAAMVCAIGLAKLAYDGVRSFGSDNAFVRLTVAGAGIAAIVGGLCVLRKSE